MPQVSYSRLCCESQWDIVAPAFQAQTSMVVQMLLEAYCECNLVDAVGVHLRPEWGCPVVCQTCLKCVGRAQRLLGQVAKYFCTGWVGVVQERAKTVEAGAGDDEQGSITCLDGHGAGAGLNHQLVFDLGDSRLSDESGKDWLYNENLPRAGSKWGIKMQRQTMFCCTPYSREWELTSPSYGFVHLPHRA